MAGEHGLGAVDAYKPITVFNRCLRRHPTPLGHASRVQDYYYVLLANWVLEGSSRKERAAKQARKQTQGNRKKLKSLRRNAAEAEALWELKTKARDVIFVSLHQMWMGYMSETTVHGHISTTTP
ncbi:hypothetical protein BDN67DRAFT_599750 [Paxillus ammoniavirescens]|nr:hypothetical protein BDN67DRAFT_599750 [Paxillus ammoniavirescens]